MRTWWASPISRAGPPSSEAEASPGWPLASRVRVLLGKPPQDRYACLGEAWGWAISHATTHPANPSVKPPSDRNGRGAEGRTEEGTPAYDLDRLERAIAALVQDNARMREEAGALRHSLDERAARIVRLEGELLEANQRRQDVAKRIDELISQMDALDAQLASAEAAPEAG